MAESIINNDHRSFWTEVKLVNNKTSGVPNMIDGAMGDEPISDVFIDKYKNLYNSVSFDSNDMDSLLTKVDKLINGDCNVDHTNSVIKVNDVVEAISQIKHGKKDGYSLIYTDHFINGTNKLYIMLSLLFSSMIVHGFSPDGLNISTIQPLVKNKRKSLNDSSNFRAIALSSPVAKIFDWVTLNTNTDKFCTSDLQYGFKAKSSTTQCTFALMETVNYYKKNNSDVYILLLDASQSTNGVKQGGVLSPILFGMYIDELLLRLSQSGYGCKIGHFYYGALGYADDVSLLAPTLYALRKMCEIALNYAREYDIKFNPLKCQLINYSDVDDVTFHFNDVIVPSMRKGTHLGHIIGPNTFKDVIQDASYTLAWNTNSVYHNFSHCSYDVKFKLFTSYCTSFYGCPLWNISNKGINQFYVTWRKAIRKLFNLPYKTHCNLLPTIVGTQSIECQIITCKIKFICSALQSPNVSLQHLMNIAIQGSGSCISKSINHILATFKYTIDKVCNRSNTLINDIKVACNNNVDIHILQTGGFIRDVLMDILYPESGILTKQELGDILNLLCTA